MRINTHYSPQTWNPPLLALIGMGMGRGDLSLNTLGWIEKAEVLFGGKRHLECFPDHTAKKLALRGPLEEAFRHLDQVSRENRCAVLASGDPLFFGIGRRLIGQMGKDRVIVLPNITSVQALFARWGESWTDVGVVSLHGRRGLDGGKSWMRVLRSYSAVAIFTDPEHTPARIAREMLDAGIRDRFLVVAEDLGLPSEAIYRLSLDEASQMSFSPLNLVAVFQSRPQSGDMVPNRSVLGLPESALEHRAGMITKMEVRAVVLAHLQLEPGLVLWDIGAGSGSISIEAARMVGLKQVVAVEKDHERYGDLVENIRRFQCYEVHAVCARASEVLADLPDPDRVFIGGSGGDLQTVLGQVAERLKPGGRVVQTAVTLDTLEAARSFWLGRPFHVSVTQVQVNRSVPIGSTLRFDALNPVFIITCVDNRSQGLR